MSIYYNDQSAQAQAAYSGLSEALIQARVDRCVADLPGGFTTKTVRKRKYWYFQQKNPDGVPQQIFVGPDDEVTRRLVGQHKGRSPAAKGHVRALARAAAELGCYSVIPKHFRIVQRMADHGIFEAGALLVGTHAFLAFQNHLGIKWTGAGATADLDFAHPGRNLSVALAPEARVDARSAIESLEMGFVPIANGTSFKKADEPDFDLDFLTSLTRTGMEPIYCEALNVHLQPLRFMEFSLKDPVQTALLGNTGAVLVNLPRPERYAVHKLIVCGERPDSQAGKARKDLAQALNLMSYFAQRDPDPLVEVFNEAYETGPAWRKALNAGVARLWTTYPGARGMIEALCVAAVPTATTLAATGRLLDEPDPGQQAGEPEAETGDDEDGEADDGHERPRSNG